MTETRWRLPSGGRMLALAPDRSEIVDLFPQAASGAIHPDFVARAAIWRDQAAGLISIAEAQRRSGNIGRAVAAGRSSKVETNRPRHARPEPAQSRQYCPEIATTAMRDDRLTPNAKALLAVLRARCGRGSTTTITKATMGAVMSRSPRTIRRYLSDLVRFGYIALAVRANDRGLHLGLTVTITEKVLPFFAEPIGLARWLAETPAALARPFTGRVLSGTEGVTELSSKNQSPKSSLLKSGKWPSRWKKGLPFAPS